MSSTQSGSTTPMPTLIYCLRWVGTSSELGHSQRTGGWRRIILGYCMAGDLFNCSEVVAVANNSENKKDKKKKRKGYTGNEEEGKIP